MEIIVSAVDDIIFSDDLEPNFKVETLNDAISFGDSVISNIQYLGILEQLVFRDAFYTGGSRRLSINDTLTFIDAVAPRILIENISDFLFLYDFLDLPRGGVIREQFVLTDEAVALTAQPLIPDTVTFDESLTIQFLPHKTITDSIALSDTLSIVLLNRMAPSTTVGYMPPTVEASVTFSDGVVAVTLPLPDFNDSETINYVRINRTSRGYTPIITGIAGWLPKKSRRMSFSYLTEIQTLQIRAFWRRNAGLPVSLTDIYGDARLVIIQNPEFEIAQVGRENRTLTLDLYVL